LLIKDYPKYSFSNKIIRKRIVITSTIIICLVVATSFLSGYLVHRSGYAIRPMYNFIVDPITNVKNSIFRKFIYRSEKIVIDINYKDYQKLAYQRKNALEKHVLIADPDDYVSASITYNNNTLRSKIRLKGDWTDHLKSDMWSYRVKITGNQTLFGMKKFSLHHPGTRNYLHEWLYHKVMKSEGIISLRYMFVDVTINGKYVGLYALEEHFDKLLLEHNGRREGPIIKFDEDLLWKERSRTDITQHDNLNQSYYSSNVDVFQGNKISSDSVLSGEYKIARNMLEAFRRGGLETHKVFDTSKLAKFFAISDLLGAMHGTHHWHNFRFYYNPVTSLLEPIAFDGDAGKILNKAIIEQDDEIYYDFQNNLFIDDLFLREYIKVLGHITSTDYLDSLFEEFNQDIDKYKVILSKYFLSDFDKNIYYKNQRNLINLLNPLKSLHTFVKNHGNDSIEITVGNIQPLPIKIDHISYKDSLKIKFRNELLIPGRKLPSEPINYENFEIDVPTNLVLFNNMTEYLKIHFQLYGVDSLRESTIVPYSYFDEDLVEEYLEHQKVNIFNYDFLHIDELSKEIQIDAGRHIINQNIVIPSGYKLYVNGGSVIELKNNSKILSRSPMFFMGTKNNPIVIQSRNFDNQGIMVINAHEESEFNYVNFYGISSPSGGLLGITGAITFYQSNVKFLNCKFNESPSEDALNIVRSEFSINESFFVNNQYDAFDGDFVQGVISNTKFYNNGNDAIDISGGVVRIDDVTINKSRDKGISIGENSQVEIRHTTVIGSKIALASKDMSDVLLSNIKIGDSKYGLIVFQKKPEFGASYILATNINVNNVERPYLVEEGSQLILDGENIKSKVKNLQNIINRNGTNWNNN
tara:strand:- start:993 stop:3587 length:2595 start_codon:yes stop_codon:yes gene_type:complete